MTIICRKGKVTTTTRAIKRDRRHTRKREARQTSEHHLANLRLQAFNYNAKQSRRWLQARLLSKNRGFVTKEAAAQLENHFQKTEYQLLHPRITDTVLTPDAKWVLSRLVLEREAARDEQGYPERVQDWWAAPTMPGKKKRKRSMIGKTQGAMAGGGVSIEGLGDDVGAIGLGEDDNDEDGEGGDGSEEDLEECKSMVMISPTGSVIGEKEAEEEDEEIE